MIPNGEVSIRSTFASEVNCYAILQRQPDLTTRCVPPSRCLDRCGSLTTSSLLAVGYGRVLRTNFHCETHRLTSMQNSINDVLEMDVFQRLCVTSGVW